MNVPGILQETGKGPGVQLARIRRLLLLVEVKAGGAEGVVRPEIGQAFFVATFAVAGELSDILGVHKAAHKRAVGVLVVEVADFSAKFESMFTVCPRCAISKEQGGIAAVRGRS